MDLKVAWTAYKDTTKNAECKYSRPNTTIGAMLLDFNGDSLVNPPSFSDMYKWSRVRRRRAFVLDLGRSTREAAVFEQTPTMIL